MKPMADVFSIPCLGVRVKLLSPAWFSKPVEFHGFKIWIVEMFLYFGKFYAIAVPYPVPYNRLKEHPPRDSGVLPKELLLNEANDIPRRTVLIVLKFRRSNDSIEPCWNVNRRVIFSQGWEKKGKFTGCTLKRSRQQQPSHF
jgi:hypothetical protein